MSEVDQQSPLPTEDGLRWLAVYAVLLLLSGCNERRIWCQNESKRIDAVNTCTTMPSCKITAGDLETLRFYREKCTDE